MRAALPTLGLGIIVRGPCLLAAEHSGAAPQGGLGDRAVLLPRAPLIRKGLERIKDFWRGRKSLENKGFFWVLRWRWSGRIR